MDEAITALTTAEVAIDNLHDTSNNLIANNNLEESGSSTPDNAKVVKDPNLIKKIEFVLNIQEVPGKNITENYLKDLTNRLNSIVKQKPYIQYNFKIITESNFEYVKMMGGDGDANASTFPYNVFEGIFDRILRKKTSDSSNVNSTTEPVGNEEKVEPTASYSNTNTSNQGIFQRLFSYIPAIGKPTVPAIDLSFTMPIELSNLVQDPITYNNEYDGVLHVLVTIYDKTDRFGYIGGLAQLENWIKKGEGE